jgi:hypothetical protein
VPDTVPEDPPIIGCFGEVPLFEDATEMGEYRTILNAATLALSEHLGQLASFPYIAFTDDVIGDDVKAVSMPYNVDCSKPATSCTILLTKKGQALGGKALFSILVHEIAHCYQGTVTSVERMQAMEPWRMEGFANWAAEAVVGGSERPEATMHWRSYLDHPETSLFQRTYDAIGFFAHLDETGIDPWKLFVPMVKAPTNEAAWAVALGTGDATERFLMSWPTGFAREPARGMAWDFTGPGIPADSALIPASVLANDTSTTVSAGQVADSIRDVQINADFVTFTASAGAKGKIGFDNDSEMTFAKAAGTTFCARGDGCICPAGKVLPDDIVLAPFPGSSALVAVTGGLVSASVSVAGISLEELCIEAIDPCLVGTWRSETFVIPATLLGETLAFTGGAGATVTIDITGLVTYDFTGMAPLVMLDAQTGTEVFQVSAGSGSSTLETEDGQFLVTDGSFSGVTHELWAEAFGKTVHQQASQSGPAVFIAQISGDYSCAEGGFLFTSHTDIDGTPMTVTVPFAAA